MQSKSELYQWWCRCLKFWRLSAGEKQLENTVNQQYSEHGQQAARRLQGLCPLLRWDFSVINGGPGLSDGSRENAFAYSDKAVEREAPDKQAKLRIYEPTIAILSQIKVEAWGCFLSEWKHLTR